MRRTMAVAPAQPAIRGTARRIALLTLVLSLLAAACGTSDEAAPTTETTATGATTTTSTADAGSDTENPAGPGVVDLTDQILVSTDADCASYAGEYRSMITDVSSGREFEGMLTISATGDSCVFDANQIPNHDTGEGGDFRTPIDEIAATRVITASPELAAAPTDLDFQVNAVMLNGVIWEAYPAACFDVGNDPLGREAIGCGGNELDHPWRYNLGSPLNGFGLDVYSAHVQPNGLYHYHSTPQALYTIECEGTAASPVIGFAADGFPVYGPCFQDEEGMIRAAESSYTLLTGIRQEISGYTTPYTVGNVTSDEYNGQFIGDYQYVDGGGDLDECNGMTVDGQYGYYITGDYPYVLACYSGTPNPDFR